ncbi:isoprenoid biosynthesis protein ElbB [Erwinia psidii]|uniref:isoprenoid biosynthesis glyoxalase ElbB n=1 Tax=Erwinia psidii TaxID=69224 RepID=UPI00226B0643|nr:isoprenoid biosynthesis glyoxalase ElbB [Erwinia psidii]MCX8966303.1 isoprenoid biosynthesis protein ElbB [Erwinia psidii]
MSNKKFAVILSGSGVYDGSEINEVVLTLLALEECNINYQCFAPDIEQHHVVNHVTGEVSADTRNVLNESARIVRGKVKNIKECITQEFNALIVPGGFGVAKNLSDYAFKGQAFEINPEVLTVLKDFKSAKKPAGYMCIAPVLLPTVYGPGVVLTVGNDDETISVVEKLGGIHKVAKVDDIVVDTSNRVVTTPAYMLADGVLEAKMGIYKLVSKLDEMS